MIILLLALVANAQLCVGKKPTQKIRVTFKISQTVPKGLPTENIAYWLTQYNYTIDNTVIGDYFKALKGDYSVTPLSKEQLAELSKIKHSSKGFNPILKDSKTIRVDDSTYVVCRSSECEEFQKQEGAPPFAKDFKQFFEQSSVNEDVFKRAVAVSKKIEKNYIVQQLTFDPTGVCNESKDNSINYSGN